MFSILNNKKSCIKQLFLCPEQDSNLHTVTGTSPSSWRVYQFHHLGEMGLCPEQDSNLHIITDTSP